MHVGRQTGMEACSEGSRHAGVSQTVRLDDEVGGRLIAKGVL